MPRLVSGYRDEASATEWIVCCFLL